MDQKIIEKAGELMQKVIKLNETAGPDYYYSFEFSGHTKQVDFIKRNLPNYEAAIKAYSYLDKPRLSLDLEDIEKLITAEEEAQKEAQNNDLI